MIFNLDAVKTCMNDVSSTYSSVSNTYSNCSWNDEVYDSFSDYLSSLQNETKAIYDLMDSLTSILEPLQAVDGKKLNEGVDEVIASLEGGD